MSSAKKKSKSNTKTRAKTKDKAKVMQMPYTSKASLEEELEELFWQNPIVYSKLCECCTRWPCTVLLDSKTREVLVKKGFLAKEASIISVDAYEVVYEAMIGEEPSWLN